MLHEISHNYNISYGNLYTETASIYASFINIILRSLIIQKTLSVALLPKSPTLGIDEFMSQNMSV